MPGAAPRIFFLSCNETPWGGSEELWARAALSLAEAGVEVRAAKPRVDRDAAPVRALEQRGIRVSDLGRVSLLPGKLMILLQYLLRPASRAFQLLPLWLQIKRAKPDLVVLSQGGNWDGVHMGWVLGQIGVPYALICQKATDLYWPPDHIRPKVKAMALGARHMFCVSRHNLQLFEEQIAAPLPRSTVVRNPFLVDHAAPLPWPDSADDTVRLACVGRLYPMEKGQDLLLRVLSRPKWRDRKLVVDCYGAGVNAQGLAEMAQFLGCNQVRFHGHVDDVKEIWRTHHGLVLPSRAEGLPLVLVEAMLAGRVAVISRAGGSGEVVDDGKTGFLMAGYDEDGLDDALERAWQARSDWQRIGEDAATAIRAQVPLDPAGELAQQLLALAQQSRVLAQTMDEAFAQDRGTVLAGDAASQ
ncbi:glycosyltransferase family 4 protein [Novosphingobium sp. TH158]|uniref:glycosyltransferase family 4 protein n=1 Tax=Novosphingobium sp. TH158 TaxID=2067455 RepID=UPI001303F45F|nr:glycosyltransferase family 4 protein [Novosphingobium sp. TH158]